MVRGQVKRTPKSGGTGPIGSGATGGVGLPAMFGRVKREPGAAHYFPQWVCAATKFDFNHSRKSLGEEFQRLARFLVGENNAFAAVEVENDRRIRYVFMQ
ncbi:hypothetical protein MCOR24_010088, partial [Pyricularia oryzae]